MLAKLKLLGFQLISVFLDDPDDLFDHMLLISTARAAWLIDMDILMAPNLYFLGLTHKKEIFRDLKIAEPLIEHLKTPQSH